MYHRHLSSHRDRSDWGILTALSVKSTPCGDHYMEVNIISMRLSAQLPQFLCIHSWKQEPMAEAADDTFMQNWKT